jgi:hypothetical protein
LAREHISRLYYSLNDQQLPLCCIAWKSDLITQHQQAVIHEPCNPSVTTSAAFCYPRPWGTWQLHPEPSPAACLPLLWACSRISVCVFACVRVFMSLCWGFFSRLHSNCNQEKLATC